MTDQETLKQRINQAVAAQKTSLQPWLSDGPRAEKMLAMLEIVFENYIDTYGEADALEMIIMGFHAHVRKQHGGVQ